MDNEQESTKMEEAYQHMLERVYEHMTGEGVPLEKAIDLAREDTAQNKGIAPDEADKIAGYLLRDLQDLGDHLRQDKEKKDLRDWLLMDTTLIEAAIRDLLFSVADKTDVELMDLAEHHWRPTLLHTGEVTAPGVLVCTFCGEELHFDRIARIPPCPHCNNTEFKRLRGARSRATE